MIKIKLKVTEGCDWCKNHLNVQKHQKVISFQLTTMDYLFEELRNAFTHVRHA
jgi:hypothetical protein